MNENISKLKNIAKNLLKKKDSLLFMGLIERHDAENSWDLLISGDWVESGKSEEDLVLIIDELKREFAEGFDFISQIITYRTSEPFIQHLARTIQKNNPAIGEKVELKFFDDFIITAYIVHHEFDDFEATYVTNTRITKEINSF